MRMEYIQIALSELRSHFTVFLSCSVTGMLFIQTVVKIVQIGNIDIVSVVVRWPIECVMSAFCGVSKRSFSVEGVCVQNLY
jgi:hypothetical protein